MNHWVALDWGTSNFRAYLMENNNVIDQVSTQEGMKFVDQKEFENTLVKNITCLLYTSPSPRDLYRSRMPSSA